MNFLLSLFKSQPSEPQDPHNDKFQDLKSKASQLERQILTKSGLELDTELKIFDVPISFQDQDHWIHTYLCGEQNTKTLVLLHGYGASSILFHKILKSLSEKYKVYCVDLLGMGLSSRHDFPCKNTEETIQYFVESLEKWRKVMQIEEFELGGLCFGGYMSTHYAIKYQERVKKLFLISPAGVTKEGEDMKEKEEEWLKKLSWIRRYKQNMKAKAWGDKTSPAEHYMRYWFFGNFMIKSDMHRKYGENGKEGHLADLMYQYYTKVLQLGSGSDRAVYYIFTSPKAYSYMPLEGLIVQNLKIAVRCFYGDNDWMDPAGALRVQETGKCDFKVKIVEKSGHNINMNNPIVLCQEILSEA